ncbi:MAG: hypothetical protein M1830_008214 [Pleopsidium flavum]|nr:MAG: hypothetical protein M1830_008214 [Pleopsidium flavum]
MDNHSPTATTSQRELYNGNMYDHDGKTYEEPHEDRSDEPHDDSYLQTHSTAQAAPQLISRARLVTIPKRIPPALPPRNPGRSRPSSVPNPEAMRSEASSGSSDYESNDHVPDTKTDTGTARPSSLPSPPPPKAYGGTAKDGDGFDEILLNGVSHSLQEEPITMHDLENNDNDTSAAKDDYMTEAKAAQPMSNGRVEGGDDFHSIPTTPTEFVMPGEWKGDDAKGGFSS